MVPREKDPGDANVIVIESTATLLPVGGTTAEPVAEIDAAGAVAPASGGLTTRPLAASTPPASTASAIEARRGATAHRFNTAIPSP
jgi:hypothetical protein